MSREPGQEDGGLQLMKDVVLHLNVAVVGDQGVGKSSLIRQFIYNKFIQVQNIRKNSPYKADKASKNNMQQLIGLI